jgi:hypothetical protein
MASETPAPKKKVAKKKVAKKKVAKKKAVKKKVAKKTAVSKKAARKSSAPTAFEKGSISAQERQELIGKAAYHISMRRHPCDGNMEGDWLAAEAVIDMLFDVE